MPVQSCAKVSPEKIHVTINTLRSWIHTNYSENLYITFASNKVGKRYSPTIALHRSILKVH